jgi:hypothetical protein
VRQINSQSDSRKTSFFGARGSAVCFLEFGHGVVVGDCWREIVIGEVARPSDMENYRARRVGFDDARFSSSPAIGFGEKDVFMYFL